MSEIKELTVEMERIGCSFFSLPYEVTVRQLYANQESVINLNPAHRSLFLEF